MTTRQEDIAPTGTAPGRARANRGKPHAVTLLLLACAIAAEVGASLAMQAAVEQPLWYGAVVLGYGVGFALLIRILKSGMPIGVVYGIWGASGVALTAALAAALFGQTLSIANVAGIVLIVAGVILVELGSQSAPSHPALEA